MTSRSRRNGPVRVVVVEDSPTQRELLLAQLESSPHFEPVAAYETGEDALRALLSGDVQPDVVSLDVELPGMDGLQFLSELLQQRPLPVVVASNSWHGNNPDKAFAAIEAGAIACVEKPVAAETARLEALRQQWFEALRVAAGVPVIRRFARRAVGAQEAGTSPDLSRPVSAIAIGASLGGPQALVDLLSRVPRLPVPALIAQHMAPGFSEGFGRWLSDRTGHAVRVVASGERVAAEARTVYLSNGGLDLVLRDDRQGALYVTAVPTTGTASPSVDRLFQSLAAVRGPVLAVVLTGTGRDGSQGAAALERAGSVVVIQSPDESLASSMPRSAIEATRNGRVETIDGIAGILQSIQPAEPLCKEASAPPDREGCPHE